VNIVTISFPPTHRPRQIDRTDSRQPDRTDLRERSHRPACAIAPTCVSDRTDPRERSHRPACAIAPTCVNDRTDLQLDRTGHRQAIAY
jgi:hypothetical protein